MTSVKKFLKRGIALLLVFVLCLNNFAAVVSDNDGAAFVTKDEFEALKQNVADQINNYNYSIDNKIDGAIASYLAGFRVSSRYVLKSILNTINSRGYNYNGAAGLPFTNGSLSITCTEQTPDVWANGVFTYQNLSEGGNWWNSHHTGAGRANYKANTGAGTAWRFVKFYGVNCLENYMNLYEKLSFSIANSPAKHDSSNYALAHTYAGAALNRETNLNAENINSNASENGKYQMRTSVNSATYVDVSSLNSGGGVVSLAKSIVNTVNNATKAYVAPIGVISQTSYGYGYQSDADFNSMMTKTNPMTGGTATDNVRVTFDTRLFWDCRNSSCPWGSGVNFARPVTEGAYEHLYWNKQYVNTSRFALTDVYLYSATLGYGQPVKYFHGLPICINDNNAGTLTFSLRPVAVGTGTIANRIGICFRTNPFTNMNPGTDSANNMKNIKYKKHTDTTWLDCNGAGGIDDLVPGTIYDFMIEEFPGDTTLWIKPYRLQNSSSTSTTVYAYFETIGDIIIEVE